VTIVSRDTGAIGCVLGDLYVLLDEWNRRG
jgi:hypothetical protein